jgi:predicted GIY-YIG superfamily endonuclease
MTSQVPGIIYLIHFHQRYQHAGHYLGWTEDLVARLTLHAAGRGARLLRVIKDEGIGWELARTWEGDRHRERQLKQRGHARCCPICQGKGAPIVWQQTSVSGVGV